MGTTAEKLSYLNETKTQIKNALETPYNVFRDYPAMIKKYIDNQPTKIATNGICNNAVELPIVSLKSKGNNYQETTQGKNLFDNTLKDYAYYGNLAKTISTGVRLSASSPTTTSDTIFTVYSIMDLSNFVGKTVRMKATYKSNSALIGEYKIGLCDDKAGNRKTKVSSSSTGQEISFVVPELIGKQKYLAIWFYANAGGTGATGDYVDYTNLIITIDNEDMTYEPYHKPKVIEINLNGNTLAKVGDIKDILKVNRNGEVEIEKKVGKINLKDIIVWYQDKELSNSNRFYTNEIIYANSNFTLSNYFKYSNIQNINTVDEQGLCAANNRQIALRINKTLVTNVNELKQWLLEHDVEVYYQLTTSEVIKLPSIEPIELWQGTNIFKLITNLETNFEVEYVVDKDSMLDEVQTAMLNAEIEI